jgi:hypothetical protein
MGDPDAVEVDVLGEGAEKRKNVDDLGGVGRKVRLFDRRVELRGRIEIERERDVLGEIQARLRESVLADVGAESVAVIAGLGCGGGECLVDLIANRLADRSGVLEVGVIAAGIEGGGEIEEWLTSLKRDGGSASFGLCDARTGGRALLIVFQRGRGLGSGGAG